MKLKVTVKDDMAKVAKAAKKGNFTSLTHVAASIRRTAIGFIRRSKRAAPEGQPPTTRKGLIKKAMFFHVDKQAERAVIGPRYSVIGDAVAAQEFGGTYKGGTYPKRPVMGPALQQSLPRLPAKFKGSIGP